MKKNTERKPRKLGSFIKKHKVLSALIAVILVAAIICGALFASKGNSTAATYSFIRTTTLTKGTLEDAISATGTVSSAKTSKVTTALNYTVKSVNVAVGDTVKKGDTIITLDTEELTAQIEKEEQNLAKTKSSAQSQYDSAKTSYDEAQRKLSAYASTLSSAKAAYNDAKTPYDKAVSSLKSYQSAYDKALDAYNKAGAKFVKTQAAYNTALSSYRKGKTTAAKLQKAASAYLSAIQNYYGGCTVGSYDISDSATGASSAATQSDMSGFDASSATASSTTSVSVAQTANDLCNAVVSTVQSATGTTLSVPSGSNTLYRLSQKAAALQSAKSACNFASLESAYTAAKSAYDAAKTTNEQYENEVTQAKSQLTQAKESLENASSSDTLKELKSQLADCYLKAEQDGTVTALNATVGSACNMESAATIQDLSSLQVDITIAEADINNAKIGQTCHITSDASDETLEGTLTQIDPTSENGSFGATVQINTVSSDIHIGMNASVEIIVSSSEDVYHVPIDAVGSENDQSFVYRKTGGEGTDMTFEKVTVTTGESNDYYIEISSNDLQEGDVIRSSADLSEGIESVSTDSGNSEQSGGLLSGLFGGGNKGGMPSGGQSGSFTPPSGGSGDMPSPPSGGFGGGNNG